MVHYKTPKQIELMRESCLMVGKTHAAIVPFLKPGVTTKHINKLIHEFILDNGAVPSFLNYHGYPFASCISVNEAVVHGFPTDKEMVEGDIVSIDIGVYKNGFHGDSAYTYGIGEISAAHRQLLRVTKESLYLGIDKARVNNRIGDIGNAIQEHTEKKYGYGVVRDLVGHGLGANMHEDPQVPNYGKKGSGPKMKEGLVIAIEPMINLGVKDVLFLEDGWTVVTKDRKASAHFEHDVHITKAGPDILSSFEEIEAAEQKNANLFWSYGGGVAHEA